MTPTKEQRDELRRCHAAWHDDSKSYGCDIERATLTEMMDGMVIPILDALDAAEAERDRMREALRDIADPVGYLRRYAEAQGGQLNGGMVQHIVTPYYLSKMASDALDTAP